MTIVSSRAHDGGRPVERTRLGRVATRVLLAGTLLVFAGCSRTPDEAVVEPIEDAVPPEGADDGEPDDQPDDPDGDVEEADDTSADVDLDDTEVAVDEPVTDSADIDADLVQRILDVLDGLQGDAFAAAAQDGGTSEQTAALLNRIYAPELAAERAALLDGSWQEHFREDVGAPVGVVQELRTVDPSCVNAVVDRDMAAVFTSPGDPDNVWSVSLVPADGTDNGTAWVIAQEALATGSVPSDGCEAREGQT